MQFFIRLNAIVGFVALLAVGSKALIAQQHYAFPAQESGYAPAPYFGATQSYPSAGYSGGFYEQGDSYPILRSIPVVPSLSSTPQVIWNHGTPVHSSPVETLGTTAPLHGPWIATETITPGTQAPPDPNLSLDQKPTPESESRITGWEAIRDAVLNNMPSAASILAGDIGRKSHQQSPDQAFSKPTLANSTSTKPKTPNPSVPASEFSDSTTNLVTPKTESAKPKTESAKSNIASAEPKEIVATWDISVPEPPELTPEPLSQLLEIQTTIDAILPRLLPAIVAVEGGSGVIISPDGHILTASHVTKKAGRRVFVRLADGRSVEATTLGTNVNSDTAALKLVGNGPWPFVKMGNSTNVELGDWCLALGYPLSFERGKPAAVRIGRIIKKTPSRFTADSPIMGGDSGGPLLDLNGELIAISSRIKSDVSQNIFVPIQKYQTQWDQLAASIDVPLQKRSQSKTYLGILGESDFDRVRIRRVYQDSPAANAGFLENDVIVSFGGQRVQNFDDVANVLKLRKPGEEVVALLNRYGTVLEVSVRLGSPDGS